MPGVKALFWVARREIAARTASFVGAVALIAAATALCVGTDFMAVSETAAVSAQLGRMGPDLRLVPAGRTAVDLARFDLGPRVFFETDLAGLRKKLSPWARDIEGRLLLLRMVEGVRGPVIGIGGAFDSPQIEGLETLGPTEAALGVNLAEKLGKGPGDSVTVDGVRLRVSAVLPEQAGPEDGALYLTVERLRELAGLSGGFNELRVFAFPEAELDGAIAYLRAARPDLNVIGEDPGPTGRDIMSGLGGQRRLLYSVTASVVVAIMLLWSHLGALERRVEMAALAAVGVSGTMLIGLQVARAVMAGLIGCLAGYGLGAGAALWRDFAAVSPMVWEPKRLVLMVLGAVGFSALGALPSSIRAALADHAAVLQEDA